MPDKKTTKRGQSIPMHQKPMTRSYPNEKPLDIASLYLSPKGNVSPVSASFGSRVSLDAPSSLSLTGARSPIPSVQTMNIQNIDALNASLQARSTNKTEGFRSGKSGAGLHSNVQLTPSFASTPLYPKDKPFDIPRDRSYSTTTSENPHNLMTTPKPKPSLRWQGFEKDAGDPKVQAYINKYLTDTPEHAKTIPFRTLSMMQHVPENHWDELLEGYSTTGARALRIAIQLLREQNTARSIERTNESKRDMQNFVPQHGDSFQTILGKAYRAGGFSREDTPNLLPYLPTSVHDEITNSVDSIPNQIDANIIPNESEAGPLLGGAQERYLSRQRGFLPASAALALNLTRPSTLSTNLAFSLGGEELTVPMTVLGRAGNLVTLATSMPGVVDSWKNHDSGGAAAKLLFAGAPIAWDGAGAISNGFPLSREGIAAQFPATIMRAKTAAGIDAEPGTFLPNESQITHTQTHTPTSSTRKSVSDLQQYAAQTNAHTEMHQAIPNESKINPAKTPPTEPGLQAEITAKPTTPSKVTSSNVSEKRMGITDLAKQIAPIPQVLKTSNLLTIGANLPTGRTQQY